MTSFFPFYASGAEIDGLFHKHRPKDKSWYEYDASAFHNRIVKFVVYGMRSATYGGRGDEEYSFIVQLIDNEPLQEVIASRADELATEIYEKRQIRAREEAIKIIACELLWRLDDD